MVQVCVLPRVSILLVCVFELFIFLNVFIGVSKDPEPDAGISDRCGCCSPDLYFLPGFWGENEDDSQLVLILCAASGSFTVPAFTMNPLLLSHLPATPPQPPAEDVDRYRRRFNMRMLVTRQSVKETPATPPPVPTERPTYKEKFIPPELSMWDYFVAKVRRQMNT